MPSMLDEARKLVHRVRCCPPPPKVNGVLAQPGGGSGEVMVTWDPLPLSAHVAFYRVYERKDTGLYWHLAVVTSAALGALVPGQRCYVVTAVSTHGLEGPMSAEACGSPVGGP